MSVIIAGPIFDRNSLNLNELPNQQHPQLLREQPKTRLQQRQQGLRTVLPQYMMGYADQGDDHNLG